MNKLSKLVGENIRRQRQRRGISQENLAFVAGIDRSYMSRVERGVVRITLEKIYVIAKVLDCEPAELLPSSKTPELFQ